MNLYQINAEYQHSVEQLQNLDLPPDVVADTIESMQGELVDKIRAVLVVAMQLDEASEVRLNHAKRMKESATAEANRAEYLRSLAQFAIQSSGLPVPIKYPEFDVALHKNPPSCEITNVDALPDSLKSSTVTISLLGAPNRFVDALRGFLKSVPQLSDRVHEIKAEVQPSKKGVLDVLKAIEKAKEAGDAKETDALPGAYLKPVAYRLVIK